jgi:YggT family protein
MAHWPVKAAESLAACPLCAGLAKGVTDPQQRMFALYPNPFVWLVLTLIEIYTWVVIAAVVMSWLVAFGVINVYNPVARSVVKFLDGVTDPVFRQVRKVIPPIGGLDISPLIVLIGLQFLSYLIAYYF